MDKSNNNPALLFILSIAFILTSYSLNAQKRFVLEKEDGTNTRLYNHIDSALVNLESGDVFYIPGGTFTPSDFTIDEPNVKIIGAGHNPNLSEATMRTYINGSIRLNGMDVFVTGLYFTGGVLINNENCIIEKCSVQNIDILGNYNISILSNVIRSSINGGNSQAALISRNIITRQIFDFDGPNVHFNNNIFLFSEPPNGGAAVTPRVLIRVNNSTFEENIFRRNAPGPNSNIFFAVHSTDSETNTFTRNSFTFLSSTLDYYDFTSNLFYESYPLVTFEEGPALGNNFSYDLNYNTDQASPQIGPGNFNENSLPFNPHFTLKNIADTTDVNNLLHIEIQVIAPGN